MDARLMNRVAAVCLVMSLGLAGYAVMSSRADIAGTSGSITISEEATLRQGNGVNYSFAVTTTLDHLELRAASIVIDGAVEIGAVASSGYLDNVLYAYDPATGFRWTANATDPTAIVQYMIAGLSTGVTYQLYVDDHIVATMLVTGGQISFSYAAWSEHTFQLLIPSSYESNEVPPESSDRSPPTSEVGAATWSWASPLVVAAIGCSLILVVLLFARRQRRRSGRNYG